MGVYIITTILAVCVGFGMFALINPGTWGMALEGSMQAAEVSVNPDVDTSLMGMLVGIVPANLLKPFSRIEYSSDHLSRGADRIGRGHDRPIHNDS